MIGENHFRVSYIQSIGFEAKAFRLKCKASYHIYIVFLCLSGIHICNKCMKFFFSILDV